MIRGSTPEEIEENKFKLQVNMFAKMSAFVISSAWITAICCASLLRLLRF